VRETRVPQDAETATHASYTCIIAPTSTGRFTTTRLINPPCLRRRTRTQHTPESNTTDSHHAPERTTTPTGFIFLSSAPYAHRSLPNTGLMSSFAHRQPPGVSTRFERFELVLRFCIACRLHPCSFLDCFATFLQSNTLLFQNQAHHRLCPISRHVCSIMTAF
jgi:hypothetical protein